MKKLLVAISGLLLGLSLSTCEQWELDCVDFPALAGKEVVRLGTSSATVGSTLEGLCAVGVSEHGHVWSADNPLPEITDNRTQLGPRISNGAFESRLTDLQPNTTYFVRAYLDSPRGFVFGAPFELTTGAFDLTGLRIDSIFAFDLTSVRVASTLVGLPEDATLSAYGHVWGIDTLPELAAFSNENPNPPSFSNFGILPGGQGKVFQSELTELDQPRYHVRPYVLFSGQPYYGTDQTFVKAHWSNVSSFSPFDNGQAFRVRDRAFLLSGRQLWEFDPQGAVWERIDTFPGAATSEHTLFAIDDQAYIGFGKAGGAYQSEFWVFSPDAAGDRWAALPIPADLPPGALAAMNVLAFASDRAGYLFFAEPEIAIYRFDPDTGWKKLTGPLVSFFGDIRTTAHFVIDKRVYIGTGVDLSGVNPTSEFIVFNTESEFMEALPHPFPGAPRANAHAFTLNGKGYIGGGNNLAFGFGDTERTDLWEYDPGRGWRRTADLPTRNRIDAVTFTLGQKAYYGLGEIYNGDMVLLATDFWAFSPDRILD